MVMHTPLRDVKAGPGASPLTTGGHGDCIELFREPQVYSHPNPFSKAEELAAINEELKKGGIIEPQTLSALVKLDHVGYRKRACLAPELAMAAEKLFVGGKFVKDYFKTEFCIFRIGEIPQFPNIELASLIVPLTPNFSGVLNSALLGMNPDLSLDILLKQDKELFGMRTSLRIPLMRDDKRLLAVPEAQRQKSFHMFVVNYAGRGEEPKYFQSYVDRWSLQDGITSAVTRYGKQ